MCICNICEKMSLDNVTFRFLFYVLLFVALLFTWITLLTLLIMAALYHEDFLLNKNYSAKTIHLHKVTQNAQIPIEWNSLGAVTPYVEPQLGKNRAPTAYFPVGKDLKQYETKPLENPYDYTMYINSERTLTILSSICPFIYLLTLVVVSSISLAYFFAEMFTVYAEKPNICACMPNCLSFLNEPAKLRYYWCTFTILVYAFGLFVIFATGSLVKRERWLTVDVEYMISNQIPSVLYNIFVLTMYFLYLKRKEPYWTIIFQKYQGDAESEDLRPLTRGTDSNMLFVAPQIQSMYSTQAAWQMPVHVPMKQELLMDSSAFVHKQHKANPETTDTGETIPDTPVSNEFNVVVCIILLLGGIANLGLVKAYLLETEAQLVILCLVMFCVLEIGRNHIFSYFWFASETDSVGDSGGYERFAIGFIDFVVFLLQIFIVFIWQYTMTDLVYGYPDSIVHNTRGILIFVVTCFLLTRLISVVQGIAEIIGDQFNCPMCVVDNTTNTSNSDNMTLVWTELIMYVLVMVVFIIFVFAQSLPIANYENIEKKLIFQEQMIYQNTKSVTQDATCSLGIQHNSLISTVNNLCTKNSVDVYKLSPVTMKVFAWTRFYVLQDEIPTQDSSPAANVLFCSNGFELGWGQCKALFSTGGKFSDDWDSEVKKATGIK